MLKLFLILAILGLWSFKQQIVTTMPWLNFITENIRLLKCDFCQYTG